MDQRQLKIEHISDKLLDGRVRGEWSSSYSREALIQIYLELAYLLVLLAACLYILFRIGIDGQPGSDTSLCDGCSPLTAEKQYWLATTLGGTVGGAVFALKWHYHSVAKKIWHQDRLVWRITAPILSGVLATFSIMMIKSDIIPILSAAKLASTTSAISFSFFLGLFSDNLLASLQNVAAQMFGTLRDRNQTDVHRHKSAPNDN